MTNYGLSRVPRRRRGDEQGSTAVEFALVLPFMLVLFLALVECGRAYWIHNSLEQALVQAGRYAMIAPTASTSQITNYLTQRLVAVDAADVTISLQPETVSGTNFLTITLSYDFEPASGALSLGSFTMSSRTRVPRT